jgi:hypothetical protein
MTESRNWLTVASVDGEGGVSAWRLAERQIRDATTIAPSERGSKRLQAPGMRGALDHQVGSLRWFERTKGCVAQVTAALTETLYEGKSRTPTPGSPLRRTRGAD